MATMPVETVDVAMRCVNPECVRHDPDHDLYREDWKTTARIDEVVQYGVDGPFTRIPINVTRYAIAEEDHCPDCNHPGLLLEGKAVNYPKTFG